MVNKKGERFNAPESHIHFLARAFLLDGKGRIVLCHTKGNDCFFLPGGHIEDGESARGTLLRELNEELGVNKYKVGELIGICEHVFPNGNNEMKHEVNMVFEAKAPKNFRAESIEDHIEFVSIKIEEMRKYNILPKQLKKGLLEWQKNKELFFKEI